MKATIEKKRVTINDVAQSAGVTKSTVSLVLAGKGNFADETRKRIQEEARRLQYKPDPLARRLSNGRFDSTVALFTMNLDLHVGTQKLQGIQHSLGSLGFDVPVYASGLGHMTPHAMIQTLRHQRPRAIVAMVSELTAEALQELRDYQAEGGVLVCYDMQVDLDCDRVIFDRADNSYQVAAHMFALGHTKVGFCSSGHDFDCDPRFLGFCRAHREAGVEVRKDWVLGTDSDDTMYERSGAELADKFLKLNERPTAVCVGGDYAAACFAAELERAGVSVPGDVSVAGHDDSPIAQHGALPLTTVTNPVNEIVQGTVNFLKERLDGYQGPGRELEIGSQLIVRRSTAPPRSV